MTPFTSFFRSDFSKGILGFNPSVARYLRVNFHRPHEVLVFLLAAFLGRKPSDIVAEYFDLPLQELETRISRQLCSSFNLSPFTVCCLLKDLRANLKKSCGALLGSDTPIQSGYHWTGVRVGRTTLRHYFPTNPLGALWSGIIAMQDLILEFETLEVDRTQFDSFYTDHHKKVAATVSVSLTGRRWAMHDVLQETWLAAWLGWDPQVKLTWNFIMKFAMEAISRDRKQGGRETRNTQSLETISGTEDGENIASWDNHTDDPGAPGTGEGAITFDELRVRELVLGLLFNGTLLPHEALCFGLAKILGLDPEAIHAQWRDKGLWYLALTLEAAFMKDSRLNQQTVRQVFASLFKRLELPLNDRVFNRTKAKRYRHLLRLTTGYTSLADYIHGKLDQTPQRTISQWINEARKYLFVILLKSKDSTIKEIMDAIIEAKRIKLLNEEMRAEERARKERVRKGKVKGKVKGKSERKRKKKGKRKGQAKSPPKGPAKTKKKGRRKGKT